MFFICISRHKLLFIVLYIVIEGSLSMFGVRKNAFSELQRGCQKLVITLDSCLLFVNRGSLYVWLFTKAINITFGPCF